MSSNEGDTFFLHDSEIYTALLDLIKEATKEVIILTPWIRHVSTHLFEEFNRILKRDVNITLLTRKPKTNDLKHSETLEQLQDYGISIFFDDRLHAKLVLVDRAALLIMSSNIVPTSLTHNHEVALLTFDPPVVDTCIAYLTNLEELLGIPLLKKSDDKFESKLKKGVTSLFKRIFKKKNEAYDNTELNDVCPRCGKPLVERSGKRGRFLGCSGYPNCTYTRNIEWRFYLSMKKNTDKKR